MAVKRSQMSVDRSQMSVNRSQMSVKISQMSVKKSQWVFWAKSFPFRASVRRFARALCASNPLCLGWTFLKYHKASANPHTRREVTRPMSSHCLASSDITNKASANPRATPRNTTHQCKASANRVPPLKFKYHNASSNVFDPS